jgi:anti-sigma factor RsiW
MKRDSAQECPRLEALSSLADNEIFGSARVEIESHIACCPVCSAALRDFRSLSSALRSLAENDPGVDIASSIHDRLSARTEPRPSRRRIGWSRQFAPAALAGIGILGTGAYLGMLLAAGTVATARPAAIAVFSAAPPGGLCWAGTCDGRGR